MGHCWLHNLDFQGSCPVCNNERQIKELKHLREELKESRQDADEREQRARAEAFEQVEALRQADFEQAEAAEEAAERIEKALAELTPKGQAKERSKSARELYEAGLLSQALETAQEAIKIDGGNIDAYMVAALVLERQGAHGLARSFCENQIRLLNTPDYRQSAKRHNLVLRNLPPEEALFEKFCATVFNNAFRWSDADRHEILSQITDSAVRSQTENVLALLFSKADAIELPWLFSIVLRNLAREGAPWLDQFAERMFENAATWSPRGCSEVIQTLVDMGRLDSAKSLTELVFSKPYSNDRPRIFLSLLRHLPKESYPWLDQFVQKNLPSVASWASRDRLEIVGQLIDSGRLHDAKRLTELIVPKADSLELEAILMEINDRLGVPSCESLRAFLKTVQFGERSEVLANFRRIAASPGRFSSRVVNSLRTEVSRRYLQWKPEIDRHFRNKEAALKAQVSKDRAKEYCRGAALMTPTRIGVLTWLGVWFGGVFAAIELGFVKLNRPGFVQVDLLCFVGGIVLGWLAAAARKNRAVSEIARAEVGPSERAEIESWASLIN